MVFKHLDSSSSYLQAFSCKMHMNMFGTLKPVLKKSQSKNHVLLITTVTLACTHEHVNGQNNLMNKNVSLLPLS